VIYQLVNPYFLEGRSKKKVVILQFLIYLKIAPRKKNLLRFSTPIFSEKHTGPINYAAFKPDGKTVVTASSDSSAKIWNVKKQLFILWWDIQMS